MISIPLLSLQQLRKMLLPTANPIWLCQLGTLWSPSPTIPLPQPYPIQMNFSQDKSITVPCPIPLFCFPFLIWLIPGDPWPRARDIVQKTLQAPYHHELTWCGSGWPSSQASHTNSGAFELQLSLFESPEFGLSVHYKDTDHRRLFQCKLILITTQWNKIFCQLLSLTNHISSDQ